MRYLHCAPADCSDPANSDADAEFLHNKLEHTVLPLYYGDRSGWIRVMKGAIAKNAAFSTAIA